MIAGHERGVVRRLRSRLASSARTCLIAPTSGEKYMRKLARKIRLMSLKAKQNAGLA